MSSNIVRKAKIWWCKFSISLEHEKRIGARLPLLRRAIMNIIRILGSGDGEKGRLSLVVDIPSGPVSPQHSSAGHSDPAFQHSFVYSQAMHRQTSAVRSSSILLSLLTFHYSFPAHQAIFNMPLPAFFRCIYIVHIYALATHHVHLVK